MPLTMDIPEHRLLPVHGREDDLVWGKVCLQQHFQSFGRGGDKGRARSTCSWEQKKRTALNSSSLDRSQRLGPRRCLALESFGERSQIFALGIGSAKFCQGRAGLRRARRWRVEWSLVLQESLLINFLWCNLRSLKRIMLYIAIIVAMQLHSSGWFETT